MPRAAAPDLRRAAHLTEAPPPDFLQAVDAAFYRARNPDVRAVGANPAAHYWDQGWREGRNPNTWFDTAYYLRTYTDVAAAGVNPLWHYLARGRAEGRLPASPGETIRTEIARAFAARTAPPPWTAPPDAPRFDARSLATTLRAGWRGCRGVLLALSHDRYTENTGGTQLLVADEARKCEGDGIAHVHLSPVEARLGLAPLGAEPLWLSVVVAGRFLGIATETACADALAHARPRLPRVLAIHNLHGQRPESVVALARAFAPSRSFFWAHDYGAACADPRLLRNGIAHCGGPPADSMACAICAHGEGRAGHVDRVAALFEELRPCLLAPSETALATWGGTAGIVPGSAAVIPHVTLTPAPARSPLAPEDGAANDEHGPVRIAFVGAPDFAKGWPVFRDLVVRLRGTSHLRFLHFAASGRFEPMDGLTLIEVRTGAHDPFAMVRALRSHRIDLAVALSPWPETFGYAAAEALAAGARLVALASSGHPARLAAQPGKGFVISDATALLQWFESGTAAREAVASRNNPASAMTHSGSTVALGAELVTDPGLRVLAGHRALPGLARDGVWEGAIPSGTGTVRLVSRSFRPAWDAVESGTDARRLGVAVQSIQLDGVALPLADARLASGWHAPDVDWRWTDGDAALHVMGAANLRIALAPRGQYWRLPMFGAP